MAQQSNNASFIYKSDRPWPNPRMKRGLIIGHATPSSARIWLRLGEPGCYSLLLWPAGRTAELEAATAPLKQVPWAPANASPEALANPSLPDFVQRHDLELKGWQNDTVRVVDCEGLNPDSSPNSGPNSDPNNSWACALLLRDAAMPRLVLGQDKPIRFNTPPADSAAPFSFGFFSCHMPYATNWHGETETENMDLWDYFYQSLEQRGDTRFVIGGGDQVYSDGVKTLNIWKMLDRELHEGRVPEAADMLSWYYDIYRGYWGFPRVQRVFRRWPVYMTCDDHEIGDGWGSFRFDKGELDEVLPKAVASGRYSDDELLKIIQRMGLAGFSAYQTYQHSHNPDSEEGVFDYPFQQGAAAFYMLDSRSQRDIGRKSFSISGKAQLDRLARWAEGLDREQTPFVFVLAAVPILHMRNAIVASADGAIADALDLQDDLRDSWENAAHDEERRAVLDILFGLAGRGFKLCILSGDVHVSAIFRMTRPQAGTIYQLTSSAITYPKNFWQKHLLRLAATHEGEVAGDNYRYERLGLYTDNNYAIVCVQPDRERVLFELYGRQTGFFASQEAPPGPAGRGGRKGPAALTQEPVNHPITRQILRFD